MILLANHPKGNQTLDKIILGGVYKMNVGCRSHVSSPYYVEVISVTPSSFSTSIPKKHILVIDSNNMSYHLPRMEYVGNKEEHKKLLLNQKSLI